ncbi:MAG: tetratricopeptide repeat protein [Trueperaceae bacterium]
MPLVGVTSPEALVPAIGAAIGLAFAGPSPLDVQLFDDLRRKEMLLILDNFEDLVTTSAVSTLAALLETSPDLRLLVTSRSALHLGAETLFDVDGLPFPAAEDDAPAKFDAVRLFADRAARLSQSFVLDGETLAAVAEVTRAVEGLPLALELAATWIRTLGTREIALEVRSNPEVLSGRAGDLPERQRSIARVLGTTFERLGEREREAVGRLALFRGGFTREAAERVAGVHLAMLLSLINHALLRRGQDGRYGMHELVRQYAAGDLDASTRPGIRAAIARYYLEMVRETAPDLRGAGYRSARKRVLAEIDNVRLATEVALADDPGLLADVAGPLRALFLDLGYTAEAGDLFEALLARYDAGAHPDGEVVEARVALQSASVSFRVGRIAQGWDVLRRVLPVLRRMGTPSDLIAALNWSATTARLLGDHDEAARFAGESLALSRNHGNDLERSDALFVAATVRVDSGAVDEAIELLAESAALRRAHGDEIGALDADVPRAQVLLRDKGDVAAARPILESALEKVRHLGVPRLEGNVISTLAVLAMRRGDPDESERLHRASLAVARASGNRHHQVVSMNNLAGALNALGRYEEARDQLLASSALCAEVGVPDAQVQASFLLADNARLRGVESEAWRNFASALRTASLHPVPGHAITQGLALLAKMHDLVGDHDRASELRGFLIEHPETSAPLRAQLARDQDRARAGVDGGRKRRAARGRATDLPAMLAQQLALAEAASANDPAA